MRNAEKLFEHIWKVDVHREIVESLPRKCSDEELLLVCDDVGTK